MARKMEIGRLSQDELTYELKCRGVAGTGTVDDRRKLLRGYLAAEKAGHLVSYPDYAIPFDEDALALEAKITELQTLVNALDGPPMCPEARKLDSKLQCALGRANRTVPVSVADKKDKTGFIVRLTSLVSESRRKVKAYARQSTRASSSPLDMTTALRASSSEEEDSDSSLDDVGPASSSRVGPIVSNPCGNSTKSVPVSQWNLKFSGERSDMSVKAFLERVSELCDARNVSRTTLFHTAIDLFEGKALVWFRAVRGDMAGWDDLCAAMLEAFLPPDYDDRLFEEIKRRTQGPDENMGMYLACMTNMFNRLSTSVPVASRIKILMRNISPFYQQHLALQVITREDQLRKLGSQLEARKAAIESFHPPPRAQKSIEPDLAYVHSEPLASVTTNASTLSCWNCHKVGHMSRSCPTPRARLRCFRCNRPDVTTRTCTHCNRSGNERGRRQ